MRERLRWRIAHLIARLPGQCWASLAGWAMRASRGTPGYDPDWRSAIPWAPIHPSCREDAARFGACYCGKLRRPDGDR